MTKEEFNISFKKFLDYFPTTEMTKEKANIYCLALSNLTAEQLDNAFISMVRNRVYKNFHKLQRLYSMQHTQQKMNLMTE